MSRQLNKPWRSCCAVSADYEGTLCVLPDPGNRAKTKGDLFRLLHFYASSYWGLHRSVRKKKTSTLYKSPGNEMNRRQNVEHHSVLIEMWSPISLVVKSDCTLWRSHYKQRFNVFLVVEVVKCSCIHLFLHSKQANNLNFEEKIASKKVH